jgi:O-methyltransferase
MKQVPNQNEYFESIHQARKQVLEALRHVRFTKLDPLLTHEQVLPFASYAPWRDDSRFLETFDQAKSHSHVDIYRCFELWSLVLQTKELEGDVLEVGVWKGGTAAILGRAMQTMNDSSRLWLADTFKGVVKVGLHDTLYEGGEHSDTSATLVENFLRSAGLSNFNLLQGVFPEETGEKVSKRKIKLCHVDVDSHDSARDVVGWVWPRLVVGGAVVFDDYGFWGCEGVTNAVNRLRAKGRLVIHNLNGHAILIKTREVE